uniref:Uncharacterized protein n=1 Tax=Arundo donax TaxID=35708 RepID=A0A0A9F7K3_ARUDO
MPLQPLSPAHGSTSSCATPPSSAAASVTRGRGLRAQPLRCTQWRRRRRRKKRRVPPLSTWSTWPPSSRATA